MFNTAKKLLSLVLIIILINALVPQRAFSSTVEEYQNEIEQLKKDIQQKEQSIESLRKDSLIYESNIKAKQKESASLENELDIIRNKIAKISTDIIIAEKEIEKNTQEIKKLSQDIQITESNISTSKENLTHYIQLINENDQRSVLNALLVEPSFSNFFNEIEYAQSLHNDVQNTLINLKTEKVSLVEKQNVFAKKNEALKKQKDELEEKKSALQEEENLQELYLSETKLNEEKFQQLLWRTKQEEASVRNEISAYEKTIRKKLEAIEKAEKQKREAGQTEDLKLGSSHFMWPVDPGRGVTAEFHDPDYPFRHIFEHSGTDIRAPQGTPIKAAESGYIARTRLDPHSTNFGYVMIIHGDGLSTLYGHVSKIVVQEDTYVNKGDIIAYSGGLPGTPGSGLSTGAHLHFEVRVNGIPVNSRQYLPNLGY